MAAVVKARRSFFSDSAVPSYRYRRRIESWFRLWGYPLATDAASAGDFERCISQTNWLSDRSSRSEHRSNPRYLVKHVKQFLEVYRARKPSVILLFGSCLGAAVILAKSEIEQELGLLVREETRTFHAKFPFTVRYFEFKECVLIALPHPTGAVGTTDAQAQKCRLLIQRAFAKLALL